MANIVHSTVTPTSASGQSPISSTGSFNLSCINGHTCHLQDYSIDARGARTDYTYDPVSGMKLTEILPPDANGVRRQTRYTWQQLQAVYKQSPNGSAQAGPPIWKLTATSTCRTVAGAACVGTADEVRTTYTYNNNLLPISETTQTGDGSLISTVTRDYDLNGNVIWVDGPLPGTVDRTYFFWNANREAIGEIGPDPDGSGPLQSMAIRRQFDAEGRVTLVESGTATAQTLAALNAMTVLVTQTTTYDTLGRKLSERRSGGSEQTLTQYSYGYKGLLECTAVRMNPAVYDALPADACTLGTQGNQGPDRITRNIYDAAGRLVQVRRAVHTNDEAAEVTRTYNGNGQVTTVIDGNGNRAVLHYDGFGRQDCWIFPSLTRPSAFNDATPASAIASAGAASGDCSAGPGGGDYERYGYDANGNRTSLQMRDGLTLSYQYDDLNRMTLKVVPERSGLPAIYTRDVYYGYDLLNHQLYARFDSATGEGITNDYDGLGRLVSSSTNMGGTARTLTYQYDAGGNRTRITHPDTNYFTTVYDGLSRPTGLLQGSATPIRYAHYNAFGALASFGSTVYSYDAIHRPSGKVHYFVSGGGSAGSVGTTYGYNPAGQLSQITIDNDAYAWTRHHAESLGYTTNGLNQYSQISSAGYAPTNYTYSVNGNLISDGTNSYIYDIENRLVWVSPGISLLYDPLGRLFQVSGGSSGTTQFLYDGDALVAEYDGTGAMTHRYAHWVGADVPVVSYDGDGLAAPHLLSTNHQGSIIAITDAAANVLAVDTYDEYGFPGGSNQGRFQYTGQAWLPDLGMYYYKARIYSPTLGRFLQTDPVGYADQFNLYTYVGDDPVNGTDPTGMATVVSVRREGFHTFVVLQDTESDSVFILRGGPDGDVASGYLSAASSGSRSSGSGLFGSSAGSSSASSSERSNGSVSGSGAGGRQLIAETRPDIVSKDFDSYTNPDTVTVATTTIRTDFHDAVTTGRTFTNAVNAADLNYRALTQNSNSVAGTGFEVITGQSRPQISWFRAPAFGVDLCTRGVRCPGR